MAGKIRGPQIEQAPDGLDTGNLNDGILSADAAGRAKIAANFFDSATVSAKVASGAIALDRLAEAVIQADGGQAFTGAQSMGGFNLTNLPSTPGSDSSATSKAYVDSVAQGLDLKASCRVKAQANVLISAPGASIDGVTMGAGDRFLTDIQTTTSQDGIWVWNGAAVPATRAADMAAGSSAAGAFTFIEEGTDADAGFVCTDDVGSGRRISGIHRRDGAHRAIDHVQGVRVERQADGGRAHIDGGARLRQTVAGHDCASSAELAEGQIVRAHHVGVANAAARSDHQHAVNTGTPGAIQPDDAAAEGVATTLARSDHTHSIVAAAAGTIQPDDTAAEGSATSFARSDHKHAIAAAAAVSLGAANAEGSSTSFARADHVHKRDVENVEAVTTQAISSSDVALTDTLNATPLDVTKVRLYLNGVQQVYGAGNDFTITGTTITWLASSGSAVNMKTSDTLRAVYTSQG